MSSPYIPQTIAQSPPIVMWTAPNPGPMTLDGTNTYVVGHDPAYVIDPGPDIPDYIGTLASWLEQTKHKAAGVLLTHGHSDHTPGAAQLKALLGGVPVWASAAMPVSAARTAAVDHRFGREQGFPVDGDVLEVIATPGHSHDHVAFWLPRARILFAGDTILGRGSSVIAAPDGDMSLYMRTLAEIQALAPEIIAPGHGPIVTDAGWKISEYVAHRNERERQILDVLGREPANLDDLVNQIYADTDPRLLGYARRSIEAHLRKLEGENRVRNVSGECWQT